jgi:hypothetical protein
MRVYQLLTESFDPNAIYLHGGPAELEGGAFRRYMKNGSDMGGLFFIKESPVGYKYALGYAIMKFRDGAIWRVRLNVSQDKIFDFSDPQHRKLAKEKLDPQMFNYWVESSRGDHLDWATIDDELLEEWGFKGAVLFERPKGFSGYGEDAVSVAVFDPSVVQIVDKIPKKEALQKYGR